MGEGKTRVILPMVALQLCGRGEVVRLSFLSQLLPEAVHYLHACLTGAPPSHARLHTTHPYHSIVLCSSKNGTPGQDSLENLGSQLHLTYNYNKNSPFRTIVYVQVVQCLALRVHGTFTCRKHSLVARRAHSAFYATCSNFERTNEPENYTNQGCLCEHTQGEHGVEFTAICIPLCLSRWLPHGCRVKLS